MDLLFAIKHRMVELELDQKALAAAAEVTESYISQLLTRKKAPPAPERTDIYSRLEAFLNLPKDRLSDLAELQRREELKEKVVEPPAPLFKEVRALILRKCASERAEQVRGIFQKQPFGELERMVTQTLVETVKTLAKEELTNTQWLQRMARLRGRSYEDLRVRTLEFLDTDIFHLSDENCIGFLDPLIETWDIDFGTFSIDVFLNRRFGAAQHRRFEFVEREIDSAHRMEPGLEDFLNDSALSDGVSDDEITFLKRLRFTGARPTALYFYREMQNLRDPLHFHQEVVERNGG